MSMKIEHSLSDDVWTVTYEGKETGWEISGDVRGFFLKSEVSYKFRCLISVAPETMGYEMDIVIMYLEKGMPNRIVEFKADVGNYNEEITKKVNELLVPRTTLFLEEIKRMNCNKGVFLEKLAFKARFDEYDTALPQGWLDEFTEFAIRYDDRLTYNYILFTTVWAYGGDAGSFGKAVSFCYEINRALQAYNRKA